MIHAVKCLPKYFDPLVSGEKSFEVRENDRDYKVGDIIALNEYSSSKGYSGKFAIFKITYVLDNPEYCKSGYVILGLSECSIIERKIYGNSKLLEQSD